MTPRGHKIFLAIALLAAVPAAGFLVAVGMGKASIDGFSEKFFLETEASMANGSIIDYSGPVTIVFSDSVNSREVEDGARISPNARLLFNWSDANRRLAIKPDDYFQPGEKYDLRLAAASGLLKRKEKEFNFTFSVKDYPRVVSVEPNKESSRDVPIDSGIKVVFDKPVTSFNINFEITPFSDFNWESNPEKKEFRIFPRGKFQYGTEYFLRIASQVAAAGSSPPQEEIFSGRFMTEPEPVIVVPDPQPGSVVSLPPDEQDKARIEEGKYIDLNLAKQNLSIFEDGKNLGTFKVSTGKRGMATPTGTFSILAKRGRAWSRKYKLFMPYFMQFTTAGHGIHELPEWPSGYKEGAAHLGRPVSHGCVRLGIGPAKAVYEWADIGTPVVIHY